MGKDPAQPFADEKMQTCDGETERLEVFSRWLTARDGVMISGKVSVKPFEGFGNGISADGHILRGEEVMRIPKQVIISKETIHSSSLGGKALVEALEHKPDNLLAAFLLLEKAKGLASNWFPYLQVLPESVPAVWLGNEEDLAMLGNEILAKRLANFANVVGMEHGEIQSSILKALELDGVLGNSEFAISLDSFRWAISIVESRALNLNGEKYLTPLVDMFNYEANLMPRSGNGGDYFLQHHQVTSSHVIVFADRDALPGTQLFMDYGDNPSEVYLTHHGFVPDYNQFECVQIDTSFSSELTAEEKQLRSELRLLLYILPSKQDCFRWNRFWQSWSHSTSNFIDRIEQMSTNEIQMCVDDLQKANGKNAFMKAARKCLDLKEGRIQKFLKRLETIEGMLNEKDSTIGKPGNTIQKLCSRYLASQKQELRNLILYIKNGVVPAHPIVPSIEDADDDVQARFLKNQHRRDDLTLEEKLERLNRWTAEELNFPVSKIIARKDANYRVGAFAVEDVPSETPYLIVPANSTMDSRTMRNSAVYPFVFHMGRMMHIDPFHEILVYLMFEYFVEALNSRWWPYLSLLPTLFELSAPVLYNDEALEILKGHRRIHAEIIEYRDGIRNKFERVRKFLYQTFGEKFLPSEIFTMENYMWATIILDTRSIWWNNERHLVPLLDMVNCKGGANRVHETEMIYDLGGAVTKGASDFFKGAQVFEDYGQPNYIYFIYHGFSLENNPHDCFRLDLSLTQTQMKRLAKVRAGGSSEKGTFCISADRSKQTDIKQVFGSSAEALRPVSEALQKEQQTIRQSLNDAESGPEEALQFLRHEEILLYRILATFE